jgi:hypothetical protein
MRTARRCDRVEHVGHVSISPKRSDVGFFYGSLLTMVHQGRSFPGDLASPSKRQSSPRSITHPIPPQHSCGPPVKAMYSLGPLWEMPRETRRASTALLIHFCVPLMNRDADRCDERKASSGLQRDFNSTAGPLDLRRVVTRQLQHQPRRSYPVSKTWRETCGR